MNRHRSRLVAIRAGSAYFLIVFAIGFGLGVIRTLLVIPRFGEVLAVCIEVPILLALSWLVCGWLVRKARVSTATASRLTMGITAFALLMLAELALSMLLAGATPAEHWATYRKLAAQIGLGAQLLFASFPLWQARRAGAH